MTLDYHMHTELTDGIGRPADYARVALKLGLTEIGCSDHAPLRDRETDWTMKISDLPVYIEWVRAAQREFPQLAIKLGLEVDFIPGHENWVKELAAQYPWDFFLGSVHYLGDFPVDRSAKDWVDQDINARWREYFDVWEQAAASRLFDSLAHPDLPKKFNLHPSADFTAIYEQALDVVAGSGCAIEVSTAGLRKPCREIYPSLDFLRLARARNIPVTLGSDAHIPDDVGLDFQQARVHLERAGYTEVTGFTQRQAYPIAL